MNRLARIAAGVLAAGALALALPAAAAPSAELHIAADGTFTARNVVVMQKAGTTLFCRGVWGSAFVRFTVLTTPDLKPATIVRNHGGTTTVDEVQEGDILSIEGSLVPAASELQIQAQKITDFSLNKEQKNLSGTIKSVNATAQSFVLPNKTFGNTTVVVGATTTITQGVRTLTFAELAAGDRVLAVPGTYDYTTNTLTASSITLYQNMSVFKPRLFIGVMRQIDGTTLPTSVTVSTNGADYKVYLPADAKVLSKSYAATTLSRFAVGDTIRVYGSIRQTNLAEVDASIIRDTNF